VKYFVVSFSELILVYRSDNDIKNRWHSVAKRKASTQDLITVDAFGVSDTLLSCTPSQNGGLVGVQPVRLFDTPKMVRNMRNLSHFCCFSSPQSISTVNEINRIQCIYTQD